MEFACSQVTSSQKVSSKIGDKCSMLMKCVQYLIEILCLPLCIFPFHFLTQINKADLCLACVLGEQGETAIDVCWLAWCVLQHASNRSPDAEISPEHSPYLRQDTHEAALGEGYARAMDPEYMSMNDIKREIGERLFKKVMELQPVWAGKVTGQRERRSW